MIELAVVFVLNVLIGAFFLWLSIKFVNKVMLNEATAIQCSFIKLMVVTTATTLCVFIPVPLFNVILALIVGYFLLRKFTQAPLIELIIVVVISNLAIRAVEFLLVYLLGNLGGA